MAYVLVGIEPTTTLTLEEYDTITLQDRSNHMTWPARPEHPLMTSLYLQHGVVQYLHRTDQYK